MTPAALAFAVMLAAAGTDAAAARAASRSTWRASSKGYVRGLARAPRRLLERVDPARGLVVVRSSSCEREPIERFTHACGAEIERAAGPVLRSLAAMLRRNALTADGPGVSCKPGPRATCRVPPTNECEPEITIIFAAPDEGAPVIGIVERDDWQSQAFYRAKTDRRIEALLARQADGCRSARREQIRARPRALFEHVGVTHRPRPPQPKASGAPQRPRCD